MSSPAEGRVGLHDIDRAILQRILVGYRGRSRRTRRRRLTGTGPGTQPGRTGAARSDHGMNRMSSGGIVTKGRIMSRSSCSRMWQWYM